MSEYGVLDEDLEKHLQYFNKIKQRTLDGILNTSALIQINNNLKNELETTKENAIKTVQLLKSTQIICAQQMETIAKLNKYKEENDILKIEMNTKNDNLNEMQERLKNCKWQYDIQLQNQATINLMEIEKIKNDYELKAKDLKDELDLIFNSSEIHSKELENKIKCTKIKYEEDLNKANAQASRMLSNLAVCKKKIFDLEEKVSHLEQERKMYTAFKTNYTATNVSKQYSSDYNSYGNETTTSENRDSNVYTSDQHKMAIDNITSSKYYENLNKNDSDSESNKFKFRKNIKNNANKDMTSSYTTNGNIDNESSTFVKPKTNKYSNHSIVYLDSDTDSEYEKPNYKNNNKFKTQNRKFLENSENNKQKSEKYQSSTQTVKKFDNYKPMSCQPNNMMPLNITNTGNNAPKPKPQFPNNKKRKLYNPNNYDYLEEY